MEDLLTTADGDLFVTEYGDISLTDSVRQAVRIRLLWFFEEWRFGPQFGIPYYEEILTKNPNLERIKRIIRDEAFSVDGVTDIRNIAIAVDKATRVASVSFEITVPEGTYREEAEILCQIME
jgi:hypothetical protein